MVAGLSVPIFRVFTVIKWTGLMMSVIQPSNCTVMRC